jgi:FKBP-type peptidyl-prolyl cis-trans isomerase FkpA
MTRAFLFLAALCGLSCTSEIAGLGPASNPATEQFATSLGVNLAAMTKTTDGLYYRDLAIGGGNKVTKDTTVTVTYAAYLADGTLFDSGSGVEFALVNLVPGVHEGIIGMAVGGRRKLVVPSALGYGVKGSPPLVPRQATLIFDIDLTAIP